MEMTMKVFFLSLFFLSLSAFAAEVKLATINSDIYEYTTDFMIEVDDNDSVHSIHIKSTMPNGSIFEDFSYSSDKVISEGAVLHHERGYDAVILETQKDFSVESGGGLILHYLYNGMTHNWMKLGLKLAKVNNQFALQTVDGNPINHFFFKGNRKIGVGVIGVREIILSQQ
jgi:hypothetical protein